MLKNMRQLMTSRQSAGGTPDHAEPPPASRLHILNAELTRLKAELVDTEEALERAYQSPDVDDTTTIPELRRKRERIREELLALHNEMPIATRAHERRVEIEARTRRREAREALTRACVEHASTMVERARAVAEVWEAYDRTAKADLALFAEADPVERAMRVPASFLQAVKHLAEEANRLDEFRGWLGEFATTELRYAAVPVGPRLRTSFAVIGGEPARGVHPVPGPTLISKRPSRFRGQ
jgi:hypothetical protein